MCVGKKRLTNMNGDDKSRIHEIIIVAITISTTVEMEKEMTHFYSSTVSYVISAKIAAYFAFHD